ncbi:hypothetical protein ACKLKD_14485 [Klebsiella sp. 10982]|nr:MULTISPECIES: hypothetical protein [Klebsiella]MEA1147224.1 hypothetical protein [Klebsiella pneumoniae]MBF7820917.1 hypothetical protein [Klebsiella quasivariicola]MBS5210147.1 hypothetical protein [Klebsiella sp.]MCJ1827971.1 hypothetical protein [Klebsiella quasivariicola]MCL7687126.1 hypothetical protein [Klebsiella quasivariicola]
MIRHAYRHSPAINNSKANNHLPVSVGYDVSVQKNKFAKE